MLQNGSWSKKKAKRIVLTKVMEMLEKQLRPAAGLRAKQQSNTMKSMKIAQKTNAANQRSDL